MTGKEKWFSAENKKDKLLIPKFYNHETQLEFNL